MMRYIYLFVFFSLSFSTYSQQIRVAVAANAQFVAEALEKSFERQTGIQIQLIVSSSGKLTTQIQQGAPFDVFLSADMKYPKALADKGLTLENPRIYAYGVLVLWTTKDLNLSEWVSIVQQGAVKKIAIANPKMAPYGEATVQVLSKSGIYDKIKSKLVYGESIASVNQYLLSGVAELAFTAKSVLMEPSMQSKGKWIELDAQLYTPIAQGVVLLKRNTNGSRAEAKRFYDFLFTDEAKRIFNTYGYKLP
jgi:molybdate transport system substrate-binding protein